MRWTACSMQVRQAWCAQVFLHRSWPCICQVCCLVGGGESLVVVKFAIVLVSSFKIRGQLLCASAILLDHVLQEKFPVCMYVHSHTYICAHFRSLYDVFKIPVWTYIYLHAYVCAHLRSRSCLIMCSRKNSPYTCTPFVIWVYVHMSICSHEYMFTSTIPVCFYTNSLYVCTHIYIYIHMSTFRSAIWFDHLLQKKMCDMRVCICACMSVGLLYVYAYKIAVHECMPTSLHECMPTSCATCMFVSKFVFMCCSSSRAATCPLQHVLDAHSL